MRAGFGKKPPYRDANHPSCKSYKADAGKADAGKADAGKADPGKADAGKADAGNATPPRLTPGNPHAVELMPPGRHTEWPGLPSSSPGLTRSSGSR
jgi:hypothetical protein